MRPVSGSAAIGPLLALATAGAFAAAGSASAGAATHPGPRRVLRTPLLQTTFPQSWSLRIGALRILGYHVAQYSLSSSSTPLNGDAIPSTGAIGITVYVYPDGVITRGRGRLHMTPARLVRSGLVGIPHDAHYVTTVGPPRAARLGGAPAARVTYLYEYRDDYDLNLQDDVVAVHGRSIVQVELDTAPALRSGGEAAFAALLRAWRWRGGGATMAR